MADIDFYNIWISTPAEPLPASERSDVYVTLVIMGLDLLTLKETNKNKKLIK